MLKANESVITKERPEKSIKKQTKTTLRDTLKKTFQVSNVFILFQRVIKNYFRISPKDS